MRGDHGYDFDTITSSATCPRCECDTMSGGACWECGYSKPVPVQRVAAVVSFTETEFYNAYKAFMKYGRPSSKHPAVPLAAMEAYRARQRALSAACEAAPTPAERFALQAEYDAEPRPWE